MADRRRAGPATLAGRLGAGSAEAGVATVVLPMLVWLATLVAIAAIDLGGYLVAASRAQALADAAALAAATAADPASVGGSGERRATAVVAAGGGRLDACACGAGPEVVVTVSVAVPGLIVPGLGARRVAARASADLAP